MGTKNTVSFLRIRPSDGLYGTRKYAFCFPTDLKFLDHETDYKLLSTDSAMHI